MPIAHIRIVAGRDMQKKRAMMAAVAHAIADTLQALLDTVRVILEEVAQDHWCTGGETIAEKRARTQGKA